MTAFARMRHDAPPALHRYRRRLVAMMSVTLLIMCVLPISKPEKWLPIRIEISLLGMIATLVLIYLWAAFVGLRVRRTVRAFEGQACPNCLYDLRGCESSGICPECGSGYEKTAAVEQWKRVYPNS